MASTSTTTQLLLAAAAGAAAALAAASFLLPPRVRRSPPRVFVLAVSLKLDPAQGGATAWIREFRALAQHCYDAEPRTISYQLCVGEEDPESTILIYERYVTKEDLTGTHHASAPFKALGETIAERYPNLILEKTRATYWETEVGYMEK